MEVAAWQKEETMNNEIEFAEIRLNDGGDGLDYVNIYANGVTYSYLLEDVLERMQEPTDAALRVRAENETLHRKAEEFDDTTGECLADCGGDSIDGHKDGCLFVELRNAHARAEQAEALTESVNEAVQKIQDWRDKAYPLDVFPEPDMKVVADILDFAHISLDCVLAFNMRHVTKSVCEILEAALAAEVKP